MIMTTGAVDSDSHSSHGGGESDTPMEKLMDVDVHVAENGTNATTTTVPLTSGRAKKMDFSVTTKIVQVANIAPQATRDQMQALFGYVGKIEDLRMYPTIDLGMHHTSKICFIKFYDSNSIAVAQHMTNTVFIDRALIVIPYIGQEIPDEPKALELLGSGTLLPGIADPKLPQHVTSQLEGIPPLQVVVTRDSKLIENQLPPYPNLPPTFDSRRIEEIRRTVLIANLDAEVPAQDVMDYCSSAGEVKYFRFCNRDNDPLYYALVEFTEQPSVLEALKMNGTILGSKCIKVYHATQSIIKPQAKTNEAAQKEIEEAMSHQAQTLLSHGLDTSTVKDKRRSRSASRGRHSRAGVRPKSRSRSRRRTRSRSPSRRRAKRSRSLTRSRSKSKGRVKRSRSRGRVRRSRSPRKVRSRDRTKRKTSRSRRSKRSTSKKRDPKKSKNREKDKDKEKDKEKDKDKEKAKQNQISTH